jgi:nucleotide-binding universal stress UspA family protein
VLGTHGRTGMTRLLMGSVAEAIVRRAPCPVLVYREAAHTLSAPAGGTGRG